MTLKLISAFSFLGFVFAVFLFVPIHVHAATKIFLTTTGAGTWTVPSVWNSKNNTIEVIGGGGSGGAATNNANRTTSGGAGGAYSKATNVSLTPGTSVTFAVGSGGTGVSAASVGSGAATNGNGGGDTYFCNSAANCGSINGTAVVVGAKGGGAGQGALSTSVAGATGGASGSGFGSTKYSGGDSGSGTTCYASGGGGAAGLNGAGVSAANTSGSCVGAHTAGGAGDNGLGGAGGTLPNGDGGGIGGNGTEWDASHGSGGGGAGGDQFSPGGGAGNYGAGGGGMTGDRLGITVTSANGAQGIIVITYLPTFVKPANNLGLVGYWSFDDGTSTRATDFSGNGNAGTLSSSGGSNLAVWTSGKKGRALFFDGTHNSVNVANSPSIDLGSVETIAFWVKGTPTGAFEALMLKDDNVTGWYVQNDNTNGNKDLYLRVDTSGGVNQAPCSAPSVTNTLDGTWHHVVFVLNNGSCASYQDGVAGGSGTYTVGGGFANSSVSFIMGGIFGSNVSQTLDDVRIYNRALTASEVAKLYRSSAVRLSASSASLDDGGSLGQGLVGLWTFDGADVTDKIYDRSGQGNNGYYSGAATSSMKTIGKLGQALQFDGVDDNVKITGLLGNPSKGTLSAWVKLIAPDTNGAEVLSLGDDFTLRLDDSNGNRVEGYYYIGGATWRVTPTTVALAGTGWHHVAYITDPASSRQEVYIDGILRGSSAFTDAISYVGGGSDTYIGQNANTDLTHNFNGTIDDVRIYNRALSATEAKQLYNLGRATIKK